ncbi:hypothetical protein PCIT_a0792 [Pseudoalteromonas citrea]|uniref:Uncharacterized protein n=1 Tax=Pseudoalteromonas citrea TaxID=43655 RepID=A0AAD4AL66_9GAMM|nr:hypothetical protein PCIT_a0792 [Pseudoalteromonas citrea]
MYLNLANKALKINKYLTLLHTMGILDEYIVWVLTDLLLNML